MVGPDMLVGVCVSRALPLVELEEKSIVHLAKALILLSLLQDFLSKLLVVSLKVPRVLKVLK